MSNYYGDIGIGDTIDIKFPSHKADGTPITLSGSPAVVAYEDNSTGEITAGITLSVDFDGKTGLNNVRVVATTGNGYSAGKDYALVISAGTVDGVSAISYLAGAFSIQKRRSNVTSNVQRNKASANWPVTMRNSTTKLPMTGLTVTCQRSKDGGAWAAADNASLTEIGTSGTYKHDWTANDLDAAKVLFQYTATGADLAEYTVVTEP